MTAEEAMAKALWAASEQWTLDLPRDFDPDNATQMGAPKAILAALSAAGWVVVPKEATEAMQCAGDEAIIEAIQPGQIIAQVDHKWISPAVRCHRAMLAAALAEVGGGDGTVAA